MVCRNNKIGRLILRYKFFLQLNLFSVNALKKTFKLNSSLNFLNYSMFLPIKILIYQTPYQT